MAHTMAHTTTNRELVLKEERDCHFPLRPFFVALTCGWTAQFHLCQLEIGGEEEKHFIMSNPFDGDRNLVNEKNMPVVLVMATAAFDPGSSVASPVNLHKCTG